MARNGISIYLCWNQNAILVYLLVAHLRECVCEARLSMIEFRFSQNTKSKKRRTLRWANRKKCVGFAASIVKANQQTSISYENGRISFQITL